MYVPRRAGAASFAALLDAVAAVDPEMRVRFTSPHPKDFSDDVLAVVAARPNVCKQLHMPAQSGSDAVLARMRRGYGRAAYDALVARVRARIPGVALRWGQGGVGVVCRREGRLCKRQVLVTAALLGCVSLPPSPLARPSPITSPPPIIPSHPTLLRPSPSMHRPPPHRHRSTDMIAGFCGESEADHAASLDLLDAHAYDQAFLFAYSMRGKTHAARHYEVTCAALLLLLRRRRRAARDGLPPLLYGPTAALRSLLLWLLTVSPPLCAVAGAVLRAVLLPYCCRTTCPKR